MIGALAVGQKAIKFGYKRYGVPGAVAAGGAVLVGYVALRRALDAAADSDRINEVVDVETIRSAVDDDGIAAITDPDTLDRAIDPRGQGSSIAMDDVQPEGTGGFDEFSADDVRGDPDSSADD